MGEVTLPEKAKLIVGLLVGDQTHFAPTQSRLEQEFGPVDLVSDVWPFDDSCYYEDELGTRPLRCFVAFDNLIDMDRLADIKLATNDLETQISCTLHGRNKRIVNIDPGYLTLGALVLATTKNRPHRIYLGQGIYAEFTLGFQSGRWQPWQWTYPDFANDRYHRFLTEARERLKEQRRG